MVFDGKDRARRGGAANAFDVERPNRRAAEHLHRNAALGGEFGARDRVRRGRSHRDQRHVGAFADDVQSSPV
jgi:hypothetical protein